MKPNPLFDIDFLNKLTLRRDRITYAKITALTKDELPIESIEGKVTGGSVNIDGASAVRRTCSITMVAKDVDINAFYWGLKNKFTLEIGVQNLIDKRYPDIIWFKQGLFIITAFNTSQSTNNYTINISGKDKMCLLNGECGGVIPASTQFDEYETIDENGKYVVERPVVLQIIREVLNHFGGEQLGKIIINDVDTRIKQVMKWTGSTPLYFINKRGEYEFTTNYDRVANRNPIIYEHGQDVGYIYTDFTYPGELIENAGSNVVAVLDKIKKMLGNYEYFYDVYGNLIWQEIKNYLNTTQATVELGNLKNEDYLVDMSKGKKAFDFKDSRLITSYSNNPQFNKIKNDFVV